MLFSIKKFYYPLACYTEKLPGRIFVILLSNVFKKDFEIEHLHHSSMFSGYIKKLG